MKANTMVSLVALGIDPEEHRLCLEEEERITSRWIKGLLRSSRPQDRALARHLLEASAA